MFGFEYVGTLLLVPLYFHASMQIFWDHYSENVNISISFNDGMYNDNIAFLVYSVNTTNYILSIWVLFKTTNFIIISRFFCPTTCHFSYYILYFFVLFLISFFFVFSQVEPFIK